MNREKAIEILGEPDYLFSGFARWPCEESDSVIALNENTCNLSINGKVTPIQLKALAWWMETYQTDSN